MKRKIPLLLLPLLVLIMPYQVQAKTISLAVSPPLLQIQALPPASIASPFTIANESDEPVHLTMQLKMFKPTDAGTGEIHFLTPRDEFPGADKQIFKKVQITDGSHQVQTLTLGPKEKKALVLHIGIPETEKYADYYFSVVFLASADSTQNLSAEAVKNLNASSAQAGIATNVLLSIGPQGTPKGFITKFSAPVVVQSGPVPFVVSVKNAGLHYFTPQGFILITNMFGQTIGKVTLAPDNILAGSSRYLVAGAEQKIMVQKEDTGTASPTSELVRTPSVGKTPAAVWPEKILVGPYTATLTLVLSEQGPVYHRTIHFLAIPLQLILGIIIAVLLLLAIRSRIKQRLS